MERAFCNSLLRKKNHFSLILRSLYHGEILRCHQKYSCGIIHAYQGCSQGFICNHQVLLVTQPGECDIAVPLLMWKLMTGKQPEITHSGDLQRLLWSRNSNPHNTKIKDSAPV